MKKSQLITFVLLSPLPGRGGWGNGYVALPKTHPCFGLDYDLIHEKYRIEVNGGLTFAANSIQGQPENTKGMWIIGFDTLHYGDTPMKWPNADSVLAETEDLKKQLLKIKK